MKENMGRSGGMPPGFIDPNELFRQIFQMDINNPFGGGMHFRVGNMGMPQQGAVMRSSNIRFENGKRIETVTEVVNGVQRQQTIISDASPNGGMNMGFRIGGGTNMHHMIFR